jgi:WD40 repeat protein/tRNA A-37 threonylcarbamoyl transferase component Bud32
VACPDTEAVLAFIDGRLGQGERDAIEAHADVCSTCRRLLASMAAAAPGAAAPADEPEATLIDHFKILRLLGRGAMGEVFLARDTELGRRVALKLIRPDALGEADAVERFLHEARVTARFSHPHIVTAYSVGRHRGRPYVALEYLEGETLRQRMVTAPPAPRAALRIALAIAQALVEAHAQGVLHRDLKPENVFLPRDGRVRVLDFGLARLVADAGPREPGAAAGDDIFLSRAQGLRGTPAYMAPEQWRGEAGTASDLWALGVMLHELLLGRRPYEGEVRTLAASVTSAEPAPPVPDGDYPRPVAALVERCLGKAAADRPTAAEVVATLEDAVRADRPEREHTPFRGLLPFTETEAGFFLGREAEIGAILERLRRQPLLSLVGPSGAGKSSLLHAGVVPRLREEGRWTVIDLRPGRHPFAAVAAALAAALPAEPGASGLEATVRLDVGEPEPAAAAISADELAAEPPRLGLALARIGERTKTRVLLVVDQLEELSTLVADDDVRRRYLGAVCGAADDPDGPVRVVLSLRDDFFGKLALAPEAREALGNAFVLQRPDDAALREIVTRRLELVGYRFEEPGIIDEMLAAVHGAEAGLPLLEFTCSLLWERRDRERRLLTAAAYQAVGGVAGALTRHADGLLAGLGAADERVARQLLLRLVTPEGTRRVVERAELEGGLPPAATKILDRLIDGRLVSVARGEGDAAVLELAHDSLARSWPRLAHWLDESREEHVLLSDLAESARLWDRRGRAAAETWDERSVLDARQRLAARGAALPSLSADFLAAGELRARRRSLVRRSLYAALVAILGAIAVTAVVVAASLGRKESEVRVQRNAARAGESRALREAALSAYAQGSFGESRTRLRDALTAGDDPTLRGLWWRLQHEPRVWQEPLIYAGSLAWLGPNRFAVADRGMLRVVDVVAQSETRYREGMSTPYSVSTCRDGRYLVVLDGGELLLGDGATGAVLARLPAKADWLAGVPFSPDGSLLAVADINVSESAGHFPLALVDSRTGAVRHHLSGHTGQVLGLAFRGDGRVLASSGRDGTIRLWDVGTGALTQTIVAHQGRVSDVAWTIDDTALVSASGSDRLVKRWDLASGAATILAADIPAVTVVADPRGGRVAVATNDGRVLFIELAPGRPTRTVADGFDFLYGLDFSPDGRYLAMASTTRLQVLDLERPTLPRGGHDGMVQTGAIAPAGDRIATGDRTGSVWLWDSRTGEALRGASTGAAAVASMRFSPDGALLAVGLDDGQVAILDPLTLASTATLRGPTGAVGVLGWRPDGSLLAVTDQNGRVHLWDVRARTEKASLPAGLPGYYLAWRAGGDEIAVGSNSAGDIHLVSPAGRPARVLQGHTQGLVGVHYSPDGKQLLSTSFDGTARLWDLATGAGRIIDRADEGFFSSDLPANGSDFYVTTKQRARRIDLSTGQSRNLPRLTALTLADHVDPAGLLLATDDDGPYPFDPATRQLLWRAALIARPAAVYGPRGWQLLGERPVPARLGAAIETRAISAVSSPQGIACLVTMDEMEVWDVERDEQRAHVPVPGVVRPLAFGRACAASVVTAPQQVTVVDAAGKVTTIAGPVAASAWGNELYVTSDTELRIYGDDGAVRATVPVAGRPSAALFVEGSLVLGHRDGAIEVRPLGGGAARLLDDPPNAQPLALAPGPAGTVVAAYQMGWVVVWDLASGGRLVSAKLGTDPLPSLLIDGSRITAVSRVGEIITLDLSVLTAPRCAVLREIWAEVPTVWREGHAVVEPPPADHDCARP